MCIQVPCKWHELTEQECREVVLQLCPNLTPECSIQAFMDKARELGLKVYEGYSKLGRRCVMFEIPDKVVI